MSRDSSRGANGAAHRRAAAAMEDTDPMTREDILEACGRAPEVSSSGNSRRPDRISPDPDLGDDPRSGL